jgi:acyl-CoA synthetase (AMP-forming)/AMP-acid ligase II
MWTQLAYIGPHDSSDKDWRMTTSARPIRSPHAPLDIPPTPLAEFVLARAAARGQRPALIEAGTGRAIAYAELPSLVERTAAALARLGIAKGHVCGIFAPNSPEYLIAVLAVARLGAVVTTASPLYTNDDLKKQLNDSGARLLFTATALAATWREALEGTAVEHVVTFDAPAAAPSPRTVLAFAELVASGGNAPRVAIDQEDLVALPYSSGTTGLPKGVMLTHRNLVANILQTDSAGHYRHDADVTIAFLPFFHIYGLTAIALLGLWSGATFVVMPRFELEPYLDLVERHRATLLHVVPPVVVALAKHPAVANRDFSSVRKLFSGAAPLGADVIEQCTRRIGCVLQQGYGLTETSPAAIVTSDEPSKIKAGSVGTPIANTECRVVDPETGRDVAPGVDGEIWIRGPQVMRGYLHRPADTRAVLDDDGWFHSGDIGHADADGHFFIVDRLKELIKYKGMQVPPAELEAVLLSHPAVADAAVVPYADAEAGEIPRAFVVRKGQATGDELMAYVASRVASYKKVRRLEFIDAIPKSPSGKILRRLLKDRPPP